MALNKISYIERIVIVLNPDGTIKGSHQERNTQILDGTNVISSQQEAAEPIDMNGISSVLSNLQLIPQIESLKTENDSLIIKNKELETLISETQMPVEVPPPTSTITSLQFIDRFTQEERFALYEISSKSPQVNDYMYKLTATPTIDLNNQQVIDGVNLLTQINIITPARAIEILKIGE